MKQIVRSNNGVYTFVQIPRGLLWFFVTGIGSLIVAVIRIIGIINSGEVLTNMDFSVFLFPAAFISASIFVQHKKGGVLKIDTNNQILSWKDQRYSFKSIKAVEVSEHIESHTSYSTTGGSGSGSRSVSKHTSKFDVFTIGFMINKNHHSEEMIKNASSIYVWNLAKQLAMILETPLLNKTGDNNTIIQNNEIDSNIFAIKSLKSSKRPVNRPQFVKHDKGKQEHTFTWSFDKLKKIGGPRITIASRVVINLEFYTPLFMGLPFLLLSFFLSHIYLAIPGASLICMGLCILFLTKRKLGTYSLSVNKDQLQFTKPSGKKTTLDLDSICLIRSATGVRYYLEIITKDTIYSLPIAKEKEANYIQEYLHYVICTGKMQ